MLLVDAPASVCTLKLCVFTFTQRCLFFLNASPSSKTSQGRTTLKIEGKQLISLRRDRDLPFVVSEGDFSAKAPGVLAKERAAGWGRWLLGLPFTRRTWSGASWYRNDSEELEVIQQRASEMMRGERGREGCWGNPMGSGWRGGGGGVLSTTSQKRVCVYIYTYGERERERPSCHVKWTELRPELPWKILMRYFKCQWSNTRTGAQDVEGPLSLGKCQLDEAPSDFKADR